MLRTLIISILFLAQFGIQKTQAQHVDFDHMHASDGAIYVKSVNGTDVLYNAEGNEIEVHPVFRMDISERKELGVLKSVSSQDGSTTGRDNELGPTIHLTYLDQVNNTNSGFDHPILGEQRRNTLEAAFEYYASIIQDVEKRRLRYVSPFLPIQIQIHLRFRPLIILVQEVLILLLR